MLINQWVTWTKVSSDKWPEWMPEDMFHLFQTLFFTLWWVRIHSYHLPSMYQNIRFEARWATIAFCSWQAMLWSCEASNQRLPPRSLDTLYPCVTLRKCIQAKLVAWAWCDAFKSYCYMLSHCIVRTKIRSTLIAHLLKFFLWSP